MDRSCDKGVSRRGFLAGSLASAAGLALAGFTGTPKATVAWAAEENGTIEPGDSSGKTLVSKPQYSFEYIPKPIDESLIAETVDCEVVVVGAGVASMGATMYLASKGVDVQVVDKGPHPGVHRIGIAGINSKLGKSFGLQEIDPKEFSEDFWVVSGHVQANFKNISRYALDISSDELMERFVRGDSSRSTEGSGLGLSIARSLTTLQGGSFYLSIDGDLFRADVSFSLAK